VTEGRLVVAAAVLSLSLIGLVLAVDMPATAERKIEVRGQRLESSVGRSTSYSSAASGLTTLERRGAAALALIDYPWIERLPGWVISFAESDSTLRGLTFSGEELIEIYLRDADTPFDTARVVAHELGHAVDLVHNGALDRRVWRGVRAISPEEPWWPSSGVIDFATGAGDFAECFATWQVLSSSLSMVGSVCTADDLRVVALLA